MFKFFKYLKQKWPKKQLESKSKIILYRYIHLSI